MQYIVTSSAVLGPPNTDRTFLSGELVTEKDFERHTAMEGVLKRRGSIREALPEEVAPAFAARDRNTRNEFGIRPDAPPEEVEAFLTERNLHVTAAIEEAEQTVSQVHAMRAAAAAAAAQVMAQKVARPARAKPATQEVAFAPPGEGEGLTLPDAKP